MRWVASLFGLGLMMALFRRVATGGGAPLEARATLALGFLLLAAHLSGGIAQRVRLPRLTGYLLAGFCVGPAWLDLVRAEEIEALRFIADAALALIAFAAGSELTLEALRQGRLALARLATGAIVLPFVVVTLVVWSVSAGFPLTVHQPWGDRLTVALVFGTLAAASSPTITMAVISEFDARGPFARSVLGVTVIQEVAAALLFTLVVAGSKALTSPGALNLAAAGTAAMHLVGSLAVGAVLGYVLARYLQIAQWDAVLFLVGVAFLAAVIAWLTGLETILIALAAGFYLENFSRFEGERLRSVLKHGSPAAYVVFFALTGAGLRLGGLATLWPWALLFVGLRVMSLYYGLRWAGRHPAVTPALASYGWLALISQAGIALGLAQLARRAFPEWGVSLEALLVAMMAVYEAAGPICFRQALIRAGEALEEPHGGEAVVGRGDVVSSGRLWRW